MVTGFVGLPGSGKTYYVTFLALQDIKRGVKVYSNYYIEGAEMYDDLEEVLFYIQKNIQNQQQKFISGGGKFYDFHPTKTTVIVDEINLVCPARFWDSFNPRLAYFWSQSRKLGLNLIWTAQHQDRVDKIVREITNYVYKITRTIFKFHIARMFDVVKIDSPKAQSLYSTWFRIKKEVYHHYDTFYMIKLPERIERGFHKKKW